MGLQEWGEPQVRLLKAMNSQHSSQVPERLQLLSWAMLLLQALLSHGVPPWRFPRGS